MKMRARTDLAARRPVRSRTAAARGVGRRGPVRSGGGVAAGSAAHGANAREGRKSGGSVLPGKHRSRTVHANPECTHAHEKAASVRLVNRRSWLVGLLGGAGVQAWSRTPAT